MITDLKRIIDQISRDKGFDRAILIEALEAAVLSAAHKKFGQRRDLDVRFNDELGEVELFQFRTVVDKVEDEQTEVSLVEAVILDPDVEMGDELGSKMDDVGDLGRIAAQSAKQVIIQKMRDAERDVIYDMYRDREGEIVNGIVQRFERGNMIVNLGRTDAMLPKSEMMPRRSYRQGDRVRAMLLEVRDSARDHQLILTRTSDQFLVKLFTIEVPEISEGIVKIIDAVREPGLRAKIGVVSSESDVDPVGACVGMKGSRVQNVVQELQGEKIDIVPWSPDPARYVSNALSPAQVSMVSVDEDKKSLMVIVPDDQLSLAIGRGGQNVRLASMLLGWKIDVKSESRYAKMSEIGFKTLMLVPTMIDKNAEILFDNGIGHIRELIKAEPETVAELLKYDVEAAQSIIEAAGSVDISGLEDISGDIEDAESETSVDDATSAENAEVQTSEDHSVTVDEPELENSPEEAESASEESNDDQEVNS